ncbi:CHRD domain-containing protein [Gaoshiqia sediminis]|uniref:CHRD domain-containing protein n=1 Tax=Gaoshiqia sediminis TaxID=2986998 RepID=A0AA41YCD8_9BACT|nr:CHRD domain-containing protein [Gaoshiqia sediminis]MCW0483730.1 CHRD domain-containing protein [Gaoshiqia sediminis]
MKVIYVVFIAVFLFAFPSCEKSDVVADAEQEVILKKAHLMSRFKAHLSGGEEVPANTSQATGQATFALSKDGTMISYKLIVANLENVTMSHIHMGAAGTNGGVVAWLYPSGPPAMLLQGTTNGILAEGVIQAENLIGAFAGQPLDALVDAMMAGNAYVNVHTTAFPGGEIRGQISGK